MALLVDLLVVVSAQELAGIVAGEAEGHLGQVVGAEGEELGLLGDLVGGQSRAGISIMVPTLYFMSELAALMISSAVLTTTFLTYFSSLTSPTRGIMISGTMVHSGLTAWTARAALMTARVLHGGDLRIGDGQTAATVTHHGVKLMQAGDDGLDVGHALAQVLGQQLDVGLLGGHELMQGGIQEADGDGAALHSLVDALEVALLHGLQDSQSALTLLHGVRADHAADGADALALEEHVLGAAQADALSAELAGLSGVVGGCRRWCGPAGCGTGHTSP